MRSWVEAVFSTWIAASLLAGASGCQLIQGSKAKFAVRPSSQEELADVRVLESPFALAVPEDAIVRVVGPTMTCSGTVIDDDLILTAHHCLVERGAHGEFSTQLIDAESIRIELGGDYFAWGEVGVRHIVAPPCGEGGGAGDVAVLVLKRKLIGLSTMTPRLEAPPRVGEEADPVGCGRCALSGDAIRRKDRDGSPVRALSGETLHMEASICPGDSGGPVFARGSREIIGVVSLSAMDHDERTRGPSVMARIDTYRLVFAHARLIADGLPPNELPPLECSPVAVPPKR
ncbi:MAG TPA: trypsin-like serine protease [Labilithrix sp.]|nr:trypsin-like serine protease [Labilithrix sp.]